ncbi:MAG: B12-binding domain-containing radical SAM protein [Oligoflexales bacterium]|nr:B12-binding domain-containing radical SAM protein [Oligoflexales bacterium]
MTNQIKSHFTNGPVVLVSKELGYTFPLSYAYLAGYLRSKGENVTVFFKSPDRMKLVKELLALNPVLVGFGSLYPELKDTAEIISLLNKADRKFPIVIGGQMVSPIPEFALEITGAEVGIVGEGEITLYKLVKALRAGVSINEISGIVYRDEEKIINTGPGEFIKDLDTLPPIPYDLFPTEKWLKVGQWYARNIPTSHWKLNDRVVFAHGGRGCPYTCNFCYHHSKPRYRSISVILKEAEEALERFDGNFLCFSDDLVVSSPKRARDLLDGLGRLKRKVEFRLLTRIDILKKMDDKLLKDMKTAGCRLIGIGLESGSDRMLNIIGKNCTSEDIRTTLDRLKKVGITPFVSLMVGQDTETLEDIELSKKLVRDTMRNNPKLRYTFTITTPFPGSALYDKIMAEGHLNNHKEFYDRYFHDCLAEGDWRQIVNLSKLTDKEVVDKLREITNIYNQELKNGAKWSLRTIILLARICNKTFRIIHRISMLIIPRRGVFKPYYRMLDFIHGFFLTGIDYFKFQLM